MLFWHLFYKAQILFWHQILQSPNAILAPNFTKPFWHLFLESPNIILTITYKAQYYLGTFLQRFTKPKYYFWQLLIKPNNTLAPIYKSSNVILAKTITLCLKAQNYFLAKTYLHILKSLTHGKYKLLTSQKYFFCKIYGNYAYFFHNQLATKAHEYHPWQNYSFL